MMDACGSMDCEQASLEDVYEGVSEDCQSMQSSSEWTIMFSMNLSENMTVLDNLDLWMKDCSAFISSNNDHSNI
jgi:hypothetical protein